MALIHLVAENESEEPESIEGEVVQLSASELLALRKMLREFAIIRGTCPMAVRALSTRR